MKLVYHLPSTSELLNKSEIELIKLYRQETNERKKSQIFNAIFFVPRNGKSWDQIVQFYVKKNKQRSEYYHSFINEDDIYQEIVSAFLKMIYKWFDVNSKKGNTSYIWNVIDSYSNRIFQTSKTKKRRHASNSMIEIHDYHETKQYQEIISNEEGYGFENLRSVDKIEGLEKTFFMQDLLECIKELFVPIPITNINQQLQSELLELIKTKTINESVLKHFSIKYDIEITKLEKIKRDLSDNLEKEMFNDIIKLMEKDVKDYGIITRKYKCSLGQVTKIKNKLSVLANKELERVELSLYDFI